MKLRLLRCGLVSLAGISLISLAGCGHSTTANKANKVAFVTTAQNTQKQDYGCSFFHILRHLHFASLILNVCGFFLKYAY